MQVHLQLLKYSTNSILLPLQINIDIYLQLKGKHI